MLLMLAKKFMSGCVAQDSKMNVKDLVLLPKIKVYQQEIIKITYERMKLTPDAVLNMY